MMNRMTITLKPRSMGELAGWNSILSAYLAQGLSGGGDFQIRMDYREGDGLTMQFTKEGKLLRETHVKREALYVAARIMWHASEFALAVQRRHKEPSILLTQNAWFGKDIISVVEEGGKNMEEKPDLSAVLPKGDNDEEEKHRREREVLMSQKRMAAVLESKFMLAKKTTWTYTDSQQVKEAYRRLESAFQDVLIAEGEIQRGKE